MITLKKPQPWVHCSVIEAAPGETFRLEHDLEGQPLWRLLLPAISEAAEVAIVDDKGNWVHVPRETEIWKPRPEPGEVQFRDLTVGEWYASATKPVFVAIKTAECEYTVLHGARGALHNQLANRDFLCIRVRPTRGIELEYV